MQGSASYPEASNEIGGIFFLIIGSLLFLQGYSWDYVPQVALNNY